MAVDLGGNPVLLRTPLLQLSDRSADLPTVLARLARGDAFDFERLRPHQEQAWVQFLVQVAALALARADEHELPDDAETWRELLLELTGGSESPWTLVVEDLSQPAFFQSPVPEGSLAGFKNEATTPEVLDPLVTAKNHDVKADRFVGPSVDDWVYGLVTLQTQIGYSGAKNYGIARMNGGLSSRPWVSLAPGARFGDRFARDVRLALEQRELLLELDDFGYDEEEGLALLWTEPWDGKSSLTLDQLDPLFVEIARRLRMVEIDDGASPLRVRWTTTGAPRVQAKELLGNLGDPWTPTRRKDGAALTLADNGWHYRLLCDLLFGEGDFDAAPAQGVRPEDRRADTDPLFMAWALVGGRGKTGGLHERILPVPAVAWSVLSDPQGRASLGEVAAARIEKVADVQRKILRPALCALMQGGADELNFKDERPRPYVDRLDAEVDRIFFPLLWAELELEPEEQATRWNQTLARLAREIFEDAVENAPSPEARHYRAIAQAGERFFGGVYNQLPGAFDSTEEDPSDAAA